MNEFRRYRLTWTRRLPYGGVRPKCHRSPPLRFLGARATQDYCIELELTAVDAALPAMELVRKHTGDFGVALVISAKLEPVA